MVSKPRANSFAKVARITVTEAHVLDEQLATLPNDLWARGARDALETIFHELQDAEESLHQYVTQVSDTLEEALAAQPPGASAAAASSGEAQASGTAGTPGQTTKARGASLSRTLSEHHRPRSSSPRAPVPTHDLPPDTQLPAPASPAPPQKAHPKRPPSDVAPVAHPPPPQQAVLYQLGMPLFTPVALPAKPPPPEWLRMASGRPGKPPPPVLGEATLAPLAKAPRTADTQLAGSVTQLVRAQAPSSPQATFIMPGPDTRYGPAARARPGTPPQPARREAQAYGTQSFTALTRHGLPHFFESGPSVSWKIVMGDLPGDVDADQVTRTLRD